MVRTFRTSSLGETDRTLPDMPGAAICFASSGCGTEPIPIGKRLVTANDAPIEETATGCSLAEGLTRRAASRP